MTLLDRALRVGGAGGARRPGVVVAVYALHAVLAVALASPVAKIVADPIMAHPRGDNLLFDAGGLYLSETTRLAQGALVRLSEGMSFGVLSALYLGLLPLAALIRAVGTDEKATLTGLMGAAGRCFGALSLLLGCALVLGTLASGLPIGIGSLLETKLGRALDDRSADLVQAAFRGIAVLVACGVGVAHDLARAAAVTRELPALQAARAGIEALRERPAEALGGWALRALTAVLLVTLGARATTHVGVETAARLAVVAAVHQAIALVLVFLRADWLALATELVGSRYRSDR
jgi:hypothetical protein